MKFQLILVPFAVFSSLSYASEPRPVERIEVDGERISPHFTAGSINPFIPHGGVITGGGPASPDKVNANGVAKAKKKKAESDKKENNFWSNIVAVVIDKAGIKTFLDNLSKEGQFEGRDVTRTKTFGPDGNITSESTHCFELGNSSNNQTSCAQIMATPTPNGLHIEFQRLVAYQGRLVYSTDDTIIFEVKDIDELYDKLNSVDASIAL